MDEPIGSPLAELELDRVSGVPFFRQIAGAIERRISSGELAAGMRLPPERDLATALAVNRATVSRAYRSLEARGLVASRVGSGTTVRGPGEAAPPAPAPSAFSRGIRDLAEAASGAARPGTAGAIDFALMLPDVELFPRRRLDEAVRAAVGRGAEVLQYGQAAGLPRLREELARRLRSHGIAAAPGEILVVNGIQQALDLVAKVMIDPGDWVAVEAPTYANILPLLKLYGARVLPVAMDSEGLDPARFEALAVQHRPKFLYTIPSFHNPTGTTMPRARRAAVLAAARRTGTLVVEDGYEEELRWAGEPQPALAALDDSGGVVYLGTFSKGLFPGLRAGFLVARGERLELLTLAKRYSDYHADLLSQAVLAELLARGDYDRHLERLRAAYRERMARTVGALERHFPGEVRFGRPEGGYTLWVELPDGLSASAVADEAARRGVLVLAGRPFFDAPQDGERGLRISISRTDPDRIEQGIAILGEVLREALARPRSEIGAGASLV